MRIFLFILYSFIVVPILFSALFLGLSSLNLSSLYFAFLPVVIIGGSIFLGKFFKKSILIIPLCLFIVLQFIPLPRSAYHTLGGELNYALRDEPFAVGVGYPLSYMKLYLGNGCIVGEKEKSVYINRSYRDIPPENQKCVGSDYSNNPYFRVTSGNLKPQDSEDTIYPGDIVLVPEYYIYGFILVTPVFIWSWIVFNMIATDKKRFR